MFKSVSTFFCYITIALYIILGNSATFNIGDRLPVKVAEIVSIFTIIICMISGYRIKMNKFNKRMMLWCIFGILSIFLNIYNYSYTINDIVYGSFYVVRIIHLIILTCLINDCFEKNKISFKKIIDFVLNCYMIVMIIGFYQLIFYPIAFDFYKIFFAFGVYYPNPDPHINRLISLYFDPNYLAQCLVIPFIFSVTFWLKYNNKKYLMYVILSSITIVLTVSRSGILSMGVAFLIIVLLSLKRLRINTKLFMISLIGVLTICIAIMIGNVRVFDRIFNTFEDDSTLARVKSWDMAIDIFKKNSIIGVGYNMYGIHNNLVKSGLSIVYGCDSSLLLILATTGIIGLLIYNSAYLKYLRKLDKNNLENKAKYGIYIAAFIGSFFVNLQFYVLWMFPVFLIFASDETKSSDVDDIKK